MSQLPDALLLKPIPTVQNMNVETNILEPVVITPTFCRFVLEKKGILDAGSIFTFRITAGSDKMNESSTTQRAQTVPIKTGIHSIIKNAFLKVGTKVLSQVTDYPYYKVMTRQFVNQEEKERKHLVKYGTVDGLEPTNKPDTPGLVLKNSLTTSAGNNEQLQELNLNFDTDLTPEYQIKLSDIFPMMRNVQLPLFVLNEPLSVEFHFNTQSSAKSDYGKIAITQPADSAADYTFAANLDTDSVRFVADYLTYDGNIMEQTAKATMSEQGLVIPYDDLVLTTKIVPGGGGAVVNTTTDVAVSGRRVRNMLVHTHREVAHGAASGDVATNALHGAYGSEAFYKPTPYNVRVNDVSFYPNDIDREHKQQREMSKVFGKDIEVHNVESSLDLVSNGTSRAHSIVQATDYMGRAQNACLEGACNYIGVDLSVTPFDGPGNGTLIGQKPMQLVRKFNRTGSNENQDITMRIYTTVERVMILKNGSVQVSA